MILLLVDHDRGKLNKATLEALTLARGLAQAQGMPLEAVLVGQEGEALGPELARYGVSRLHLVTHPALGDYAPEAWAQSLVHLIQTESPWAVTGPGTDRGNEVLAHVAARLDQPLAANCVEVQPGEPVQLTRVRWGGSLLEEATLAGQPKLFTVAPQTIPPEEAGEIPELAWNRVTPPLTDRELRVQVVERQETAGDKVSLVDARVVVGGGRGVGSAEGFQILEDLAELLGGAVGCSRAVTNEGWRPHTDQIGQTGTRIAPEIYIACGISGAIQHYVGCKGSRHILAINTDPEAAIVSKANWAIIGDLHQVVPAINAALRKALGE